MMSEDYMGLVKRYYELQPHLVDLRNAVLEIMNRIILIENGPLEVDDVMIIPESSYAARLGTTQLLTTGDLVVWVTVARPIEEVADTILHELAHVILGVEHIRRRLHDDEFQMKYEYLTEKYTDDVLDALKSSNGLTGIRGWRT